MRHRFLRCAALITALLLTLPACGKTEAPPPTTTVNETTAIPISTTSPETTAAITEAQTTAAPIIPAIDSATLPRTVNGGSWDSGHVQGIAIDAERKYMYFSFTDRLVKTDLDGNVIGSVEKFSGHLGDLDYNAEDGRVYGSLYIQNRAKFYVAVFDVDKIDRVGMDAAQSDLMSVILLPEVGEDYQATVGGLAHRYGCYGIDGISFGPAFGAAADSPTQLMVAYAIYGDTTRNDNDHQIILQFDWRKIATAEVRYSADILNIDGVRADARYFVYTGNTTYGVQNLEYDANTGYWLIAAYAGQKAGFLNFTFFAVDGSIPPIEGEIVGQHTPERGMLLTLAEVGLRHAKSGTRGWLFSTPSTGMIALDDGYFYICKNAKVGELQTADTKLYRWVGSKAAAMELVSG